MFDRALQFVPVYVLVVFRLAGMALFAPLFGISRQGSVSCIRGMMILVIAMGIDPVDSPAAGAAGYTWWELALGISGESRRSDWRWE